MIEWILLYAFLGLIATIRFLLWVVNEDPTPRKPLGLYAWSFIGLILFFGIILWFPFIVVWGASWCLDKVLHQIEIRSARKYARDYDKRKR